MNSKDSIKTILDLMSEREMALFTTGFISRLAFAHKDRPANFYMIGSMGLVSSVGLGIALNSSRRVVIFDGDGSALMDMGTMAMIGSLRPKNIIHIVLDNQSYESTGGQPSLTEKVRLDEVARASGYNSIFRIDRLDELERVWKRASGNRGPVFMLLDIKKKAEIDTGRVSIPPEALTARIRKGLSR